MKMISTIEKRFMLFTDVSLISYDDFKLSFEYRLALSLIEQGCSVILVFNQALQGINKSDLDGILLLDLSLDSSTIHDLETFKASVSQLFQVYKPSVVSFTAHYPHFIALANLAKSYGILHCYINLVMDGTNAIGLEQQRFLANHSDIIILNQEIKNTLHVDEELTIQNKLRIILKNSAALTLEQSQLQNLIGTAISRPLNFNSISSFYFLTPLSTQSFVNTLSVNEGEILNISAASKYLDCSTQQKKAVVTVNCFDEQDNFVNKADGFLQYSKQLKAFYTYFNCTQGQLRQIYAFKVPAGVAKIAVGIRSFNTTESETVFLGAFNVSVNEDNAPVSFTPPSVKAAAISIIGWPQPAFTNKPVVLGIMDEFTTGCFEQDVTLIQPRPDNWFALIEKYQPELIFIESAWKGNNGSWQYRIAEYANKPGNELQQLVSYAEKVGIPVVFWNKEDPVHHDKFMGAAKLADYIFTTDSNMIPSYQRRTRNKNAQALAFAAQPVLHKPAALAKRKPASCFAGSWYGNRHAERGESMRWLLQAANKYPLDIYDRNFGTSVFPFPDEFSTAIKGSLPYLTLCEEYNKYRVFLNVNSVTESPTMFSRRVFELMACGTPVVSTYARGIAETFHSDAVWLINSQQEAEEAIATLLNDDVEWRRRSLAGIREVFSYHTYAHRFDQVFAAVGSAARITPKPKLALFTDVISVEDIVRFKALQLEQSYKHTLPVVLCQEGKLASFALEQGCLVVESLEQLKAFAIDNGCEFIACVSLNTNYGKFFLQDLVNATVYQPTAAFWGVSEPINGFNFGLPIDKSAVLLRPEKFHVYISAKETWIQSSDGFGIDSDQVNFALLKKGL